MSIKLIAVDMDGTFLNDKKTYNRQRFLNQFERMKKKDIHFVVASGNQYYQLVSFFPEIANEISFIAENGGWIVIQGEDIFNTKLSKENFNAIIKKLLKLPKVEIVACGKNNAYTLRRYSKKTKTVISHYYHHLKIVDDFYHINDTLIKVGLNLPNDLISNVQLVINSTLGKIITPVTTGVNNIDLIVPGIHKANGLRILQKRWGINDSEVVAFGDNSNDIEMLRQSGFSFAMANAQRNIKAVARYEAPDNNSEGVLEIIEKALNKEAPFY